MSYESDRSKSRIIGVDFARAVATGKHVMARSSRLTALDSLRGFGILLVVLGHASRSASLVSWIFSFHMPLFFIISGMLFHERQFLDSFKKKVTRLLIPYLFFGIVTFVYWALIERRFRVGGCSYVFVNSLGGVDVSGFRLAVVGALRPAGGVRRPFPCGPVQATRAGSW